MIPRILQRAGFVLALLGLIPAAALGERLAVSPEEARAIARDAYIYGFPLVDSYRIQYSYFVDRASPSTRRRGTSCAASRGCSRRRTRRCRPRTPTPRTR